MVHTITYFDKFNLQIYASGIKQSCVVMLYTGGIFTEYNRH